MEREAMTVTEFAQFEHKLRDEPEGHRYRCIILLFDSNIAVYPDLHEPHAH